MTLYLDEILCYRTPDKKIFPDEKKAIQHIENNIGPLLEAVFTEYHNATPSFNSTKLVLHLIENDEKLTELKRILNKWIM